MLNYIVERSGRVTSQPQCMLVHHSLHKWPPVIASSPDHSEWSGDEATPVTHYCIE